MPQHRRATWLVIAALTATFCFSAPAATVVAGVGDARCTNQTDALHPPAYIRVQRLSSGHSGEVDQVPFWNYVGTVLRGEYGTGVRRSPHWLRVGAMIVKQYAWYYVVKWRGSHNAAGECFHVKDTTADQMYKPEFYTPNSTNLSAMRDTWHMALRKWVPDKSQSTIFLTSYRTGLRKPCGADAIGHRIYQKSLRDCENKNLVLEEMLRKYFEPNLQIVDTRGRDAVEDNGAFNGDLVTFADAGNATAWRTYAGSNGSWANGTNGEFEVHVSSVLGQGVGNMDTTRNNTTEPLADVILLVDNGSGRELRVHRATGNGFIQTPDTKVVDGNASKLLVADFNGDQRVDAGLLTQNGSQATLNVILLNRERPDNTFEKFVPASEWWSGNLDLSTTQQLAGDTDGDGKADLVVRQADGSFAIAHSDPSCSTYSEWGPCPTASIASNHLGSLENALSSAAAPATSAKLALTDFNRDGRDDVVAVRHNGSDNVTVFGMRGKGDGTLMDPIQLWQGTPMIPFANLRVVGMNVNSDSLGDVALVSLGDATKPVWLRTSEQTKTSPPLMTLVPSNDALTWSTASHAF
ncbi:MAG TPA: hypothetical protein VMZ33_03080 [Candidatus Limnocylindrales bacterium]|nr:hypothetical protein [Candidatus Limnocylindrales bacterium]